MPANEIVLVADFEGCHFEIKEDQLVGFYVFRFVGKNSVFTHDYLQDNLAMAKLCALDEWGVPESIWVPESPSNPSWLPE